MSPDAAARESKPERQSSVRSRTPAGGAANPLLGLQDEVGNRGVQRLALPHLSPAPAPLIQRACAGGCGGTCPDCEEEELGLIQRQAGPENTGLPAPPRALPPGGSGQPLDASTRADLEPLLGHDLGGVRVHTDAAAADAAKSLRAEAFTVGQDIYFAAGRYQPGSPAGQRLLAHELVHTIQQGAGAGGPGDLTVAPATGLWERQAEESSRAVLAGGEMPALTPVPAQAAQRQPASPAAAAPAQQPVAQQLPECGGLLVDTLTTVASSVAAVAGQILPGSAGDSATALSKRLAARPRGSPEERVRRALANQNIPDAFCVLSSLSMQALLPTLVALANERAVLLANLPAAGSSQDLITLALDAVEGLLTAGGIAVCTNPTFVSLDPGDREALVDFLFPPPQGISSPAGTFFGQPIPGVTRGLRTLLEQAQRIAKRSLCINGKDPKWQAREPIVGFHPDSVWHGKTQAIDLEYKANPYIMHEEGEEKLDRALGPVYHRIAGLILRRRSIIPQAITTVKPDPSGGPMARTWQPPGSSGQVTITTGGLWDLLKVESDAMATYFGLLRSAAPAGAQPGAPAPGAQPVAPATPNLESPTTLDDYLALLLSSVGIQANTGLKHVKTAADLRTQIARDYLVVGGTLQQLQALTGQAAKISEPPNPGGDRPFAGGQPAGATKPGGAPDPASFRRPESGFLSIPREVVEALTQVGLSWGAIDIPGAQGDVQHFDCRLKGGCP